MTSHDASKRGLKNPCHSGVAAASKNGAKKGTCGAGMKTKNVPDVKPGK